ncbi:MAG: tRNA lysidine(34) synthetase TilS [Armatimonadota bacterium]
MGGTSEPTADALLEGAREAIRRFRLLEAGQSVVVGVSGGQDSVALLDVLVRLAEELRLGLHVAHLNHQLRGDEADRDEAFVRDLAGRLGVPVTVGREDVLGEAASRRCSVEMAARQVRYAFLEGVAREQAADRIAVGHTASDVAETVLMNLMRGCGLDGLSGIPPRRGRVVRPLILALREDTLEYCRNRNLQYVVDCTNLVPDTVRNRVRLRLLPLLERKYASGIQRSLSRLAELVRGDAELLLALAENELRRAIVEQTDEQIVLDARVLREEPEPLRRRVVREAIRRVRGHLRDIGLHQFDAVSRLIRVGEGTQRAELGLGLWAERSYDRLAIGRGRPPEDPGDVAVPLSVPGTAVVVELACVIEADVVCRARWAGRAQESPYDAAVDFGVTGRRLCVRNWRTGDRFRPLGMSQDKKLQDFFTDAKVPRGERRRVPIVVGESGAIVWVVGHRIDDRAKVSPATEEVLMLGARGLTTDERR